MKLRCPRSPAANSRADAPQEVDELRALEAALDVELRELEDVGAAVGGLRLDDARVDAGARRRRRDGRLHCGPEVPGRDARPAVSAGARLLRRGRLRGRVRPRGGGLLLREGPRGHHGHERRHGQRDHSDARATKPHCTPSLHRSSAKLEARIHFFAGGGGDGRGGGEAGAAGAGAGGGAFAAAADRYFSASARSG